MVSGQVSGCSAGVVGWSFLGDSLVSEGRVGGARATLHSNSTLYESWKEYDCHSCLITAVSEILLKVCWSCRGQLSDGGGTCVTTLLLFSPDTHGQRCPDLIMI